MPRRRTPEEQAHADALKALVAHNFHAKQVDEVWPAVGSRPGGLTASEVSAMKETYGPNSTPTKEKPSLLYRIGMQLHNSVIYILIAAAVASAIFSEWAELALIIIVIVVNVLIGIVQEGKAEAAAEALNKMLAPRCTVVRGGQQTVVNTEDVVIGDVVYLQAGDAVGADIRLFAAADLKVKEAALTGESEDVLKTTQPVAEDAGLGDQHCMAFAGTSVSSGSGQGVVVAIGPAAQVGSIKQMIDDATATDTPLQQQLEVFGRVIAVLCIIIAGVVIAIAIVARGYSIGRSIGLGVSIAVAIIPEGLPAVVTVVMAVGVRRMAEHNAIVRQLPAVETLGSVSVICSDKTGTLTMNEMAVTSVCTASDKYAVAGQGYDPYSGDVQGLAGALRKQDPATLDALFWLALPGVLANDGGLVAPSALASMWPSRRGLHTEATARQALATAQLAPGHPIRDTGGATTAPPAANPIVRSASVRQTPPEGEDPATNPPLAPGVSIRRLDSRPANATADGAEAHALNSPRVDAAAAEAAAGERWETVGDPTDVAVLVLGHKLGINGNVNAFKATYPEIARVPFSSDYKFICTMQDVATPAGTKRLVYIKGAWDEVIGRCSTQAAGGDAFRPEPIDAARWMAEASQYASNGMRVLAVAQWEVPPDKTTLTIDEVRDAAKAVPCLQMNCLLAIIDPCRESAARAIEQCHHAGISVKMITGDHAATAVFIARQLGIISDATFAQYEGVKDTDPEARKHIVLRGDEIQEIPADEKESQLAQYVLDVCVFARVSPEHKLRIVRALKETHGRITSMTGDGVNDAPALKEAHIGVAMGITGTEVAKSAARVILADDKFATIAEAVRRGRGVYDNLRKVILFSLPTNFSQGLSVAVSIAIGMEDALTPIQILTVNLIASVTLGIVMAFEEPEVDVMDRPPRNPSAPLLDLFVAWRTFYVTVLLVTAILGNFEWQRASGGSLNQCRAVAMTTLVVAQVFYAFNCRFVTNSSLTYRVFVGNVWLLIASAFNIALQCLLIYTPGLNEVWSMEFINGFAWLRILLLSVCIFLIVEVEKWFGPRYVAPVATRVIPRLSAHWQHFSTVTRQYLLSRWLRRLVPFNSTSATGFPTTDVTGDTATVVDMHTTAPADVDRDLRMSRRQLGHQHVPPARPEASEFVSRSRRNLTLPGGVSAKTFDAPSTRLLPVGEEGVGPAPVLSAARQLPPPSHVIVDLEDAEAAAETAGVAGLPAPAAVRLQPQYADHCASAVVQDAAAPAEVAQELEGGGEAATMRADAVPSLPAS